jgi:hypothetical protein
MRFHQQPWSYSLSDDEAARLPTLSAKITFDEITDRIANELKVLCCHPSAIDGTDFRRPIYTLHIGRPLFDQFFNSPVGYRAAYFQSPGIGLDANVFFMQAIAKRLAADPSSVCSTLSTDFIHESLMTPSAKAWLAEHGKEVDLNCPTCKGEWSSGSSGPAQQAEILNDRWETASGQKSEWGRKAPYLTKLRIMGAFLNDRHHELVPYDKRFRAYEIHKFGWS